MKKTILLLLMLAASLNVVAGKDKNEKKDWGYLTGSLESVNHVYVEDEPNGFYPSMQPNLKEGNIFATNNYLKLDYYKDRLSAGMQMEGYFPTLVGYPIAQNKLSISNLYATWRDKSYSVTAGTFYEQFGSGLLFRSWEDRTLGLNNAMLGARASRAVTKRGLFDCKPAHTADLMVQCDKTTCAQWAKEAKCNIQIRFHLWQSVNENKCVACIDETDISFDCRKMLVSAKTKR